MEESRESLRKVVHQRQPWHTRVEVYLAVCACVLALCIFSMVYPSRNIDDLVRHSAPLSCIPPPALLSPSFLLPLCPLSSSCSSLASDADAAVGLAP
eukprot:3635273-Rhodomonas_salina.1